MQAWAHAAEARRWEVFKAAHAARRALHPERHYIQFDGLTSYAYAPLAAQGVKDTLGWTLVLKVADRIASVFKHYGLVYDSNVTAQLAQCSILYSGGGDAREVWAAGFSETSGALYDYRGTDATTGESVVSLYHRDTVTRRVDLRMVKGGATLQSQGGNFSKSDARTPLHVGLGAHVYVSSGVHTPQGGSYGAAKIIAAALVRDEATEAELQAYSLVRDARLVWGASKLFGYWTASNLLKNLVSGKPDMTLVAVGAADLVAL